MTRRFNHCFVEIALLVALFATLLPISAAQAAPINRRQLWATDGVVRASVQRGGTLYIGGNFSYVAPMVRNFALLQPTGEGRLAMQAPRVNNTIFAIEPDGFGGWFIGGAFSSVDGLTRNGIAHILPDGTVNPTWNPNPDVNSVINVLKRSGSVLYVGGNFATIGGQTRPFLAALNTTGTGTATTWNPSAGGNVNGEVFALAVSGSTLYVGGRFTFIGGQTRNRAAAFTLPSNTANSWNPNVGGAGSPTVFTISVTGSTAYLGGQFDTVGGPARNALAATNATTGAVTTWAPNVVNIFGAEIIYAIIATASTVYIGGQFTDIGTSDAGGIAALSATTGALVAGWQADTTGAPIYSMALVGNTLYIGGYFSLVTGYGGIARSSIAALNATNGSILSWNPRAQIGTGLAGVNAIAVQNNVVAAGGTIDLIGGIATESVAALNINTGEAFSNFIMDIESFGDGVHALVLSSDNNTLFMGGDFDQVGINGSALQNRTDLASINLINNTLNPWNPGANSPGIETTFALAVSGNTLYVGGTFSELGGQTRNYLGAVSTITGTTTTWNPNANGTVFTMDISGNTLYVGGQFSQMFSTTRNNAAAFDLTTGNLTSWNPNVTPNRVEAIEATPSVVYLGGWFTNVGGNTRRYAAAVNTTTGAATAWNPDLDNFVYSIAVGNGGTVYVGGDFSQAGTTARSGLAAFSPAGALLSWNPGMNDRVYDLRTFRGEVFVGGRFSAVNGFRWLNFGSVYEPASAQDTIGVFRAGNSFFYLRNANSAGPITLSIRFGSPNDIPLTGDWNGDGVDTIGVYRPSNSTFYLSNTATSTNSPAPVNITAVFGLAGDIPVVGDWNGDGIDSIGVFRPSTGRFLLRDANSTGPVTYNIGFGVNGDRPFAGNWNGVGGDTPGVWRPGNRIFYLTNTLCTNCSAPVNLNFSYGLANDLPFVGDWDGNGKTGVGVFRPSNKFMYLRNTLSAGNPEISFSFGLSTDKPVAGHWVSGPLADEPVAPSFVPKQ